MRKNNIKLSTSERTKMPPLSKWTIKHGKLHLQWKDKSVSRFPFAWLLDHQKTNWHPATNQKINPASVLSAEMLDNYHISHVAIDDNGIDLRIDWIGKPSIRVGIAEMKRHTTLSSRWGLPEKRPWKALNTMPSSSALENTDAKTILHDLAVHGVHLVTNMPSTVSETEKFIRERLGPPRETFYGGMWDTAPRKENVNDTAYTYDALDPHTDTCYLIDSPGLQCFNCVAQDAGAGGKTRLVDSEMVVTILKASYPETFKYFTQTPLVFHHTEKGLFARVCAPVISLEHDLSSMKQFRYNEYDLAPLDYMSMKEIDAFYHHNNILVKVIKESEHSVKLRVGDMLLIDNHRVMHGRTAFKGYRNLVGCYVGADDWIMRARSLFAALPEHHVSKPREQGEQTIYESEWRHL